MARMREAAVAGRFYPGDPRECQQMLERLLAGIEVSPAPGALVPHAGWVFSGRTAAYGWQAIAAYQPETIVIFGAIHTHTRALAGISAADAWETPLGPVPVARDLALQLANTGVMTLDDDPHHGEHAIEVQMPFVRHLLPAASVIPIAVQPTAAAETVGNACGEILRDTDRRVALVASTDLTHYGPNFGFEPAGHGIAGLQWAKTVNDRRFLDVVTHMDARALVAEAASHQNACGAGAVAALVAALRTLGHTTCTELDHTTSDEVYSFGGARDTSVGYAACAFN